MLCPALPGHLNPMIALGRELKQRGHDVTFFQVKDVEDKIGKEGLEFKAIGESDYPLGSLKQFLKKLGELKGVAAVRYWHEDHQKIAGIVCHDAPKAIKDEGVEALLVDQLEPAGAAVAEHLGLPFVTVCNALALNREAGIPPIFTNWVYQKNWWAYRRNQILYYLGDLGIREYSSVLAQYRQQWKLLKLIGSELLFANSKLAQVSQQPAAFDFPRTNLPEYFHYTAPWRNQSPQTIPFPWERLTGQPIIYASLGTLQISKYEIFKCIAEACNGLDVQLVISHGRGMSEAEVEALPGSHLVVPYAPQVELLARKETCLTITHAGLNTVLDSLTFGLPLVAIPITFEQPAIAARIKWTGIGEVIPATQLSVSRLRTTVQKVLADAKYAQNASKMKESISQGQGVQKAADIVEQAIKTKKSVLVARKL